MKKKGCLGWHENGVAEMPGARNRLPSSTVHIKVRMYVVSIIILRVLLLFHSKGCFKIIFYTMRDALALRNFRNVEKHKNIILELKTLYVKT